MHPAGQNAKRTNRGKVPAEVRVRAKVLQRVNITSPTGADFQDAAENNSSSQVVIARGGKPLKWRPYIWDRQMENNFEALRLQ